VARSRTIKDHAAYDELRRQGFSKQAAARSTNHDVKWAEIAKKGWRTRRQQG